MTQILNVTRNDDGQYQVADQAGKLVDGPFETNAAAWRALDRLDRENANAPPKYRSGKKVLWGKPERPKSKKGKRKDKQRTAQRDRQMKRDAAKAPAWVRSVAAAKFEPGSERAYRDHRLGTFGPASEVRHIDVAQYLAEKARGA